MRQERGGFGPDPGRSSRGRSQDRQLEALGYKVTLQPVPSPTQSSTSPHNPNPLRRDAPPPHLPPFLELGRLLASRQRKGVLQVEPADLEGSRGELKHIGSFSYRSVPHRQIEPKAKVCHFWTRTAAAIGVDTKCVSVCGSTPNDVLSFLSAALDTTSTICLLGMSMTICPP